MKDDKIYQELKANLDHATAEMKAYEEVLRKKEIESDILMSETAKAQREKKVQARRDRLQKMLEETPDNDKLTSRQVAELVDIPLARLQYYELNRFVKRNNDGYFSKSEVKAWLHRAYKENGYRAGDNEIGHGYMSKEMIEKAEKEKQHQLALEPA